MKEDIPFIKEPLEGIGEGFFTDVYRLKEDPRFVVKEYRFPLSDDNRIREAIMSKEEFLRLKRAFGDFIPDTDFIFGKRDDGNKTFFIIQRRVVGKELSNDIIKEDKKIREQLSSFIMIAVKNYIRLYDKNSDKSQFPDIKPQNFIWGRVFSKAGGPTEPKLEKTEEDRLYYVDTTTVFFDVRRLDLKYRIKEFEDLGLDLSEAKKMLADFSFEEGLSILEEDELEG